jgi:WD40 repeat protein
MGCVYEGEEVDLDRRVAVKVSLQSRGKLDPRFLKEAKVLAMLSHPNIVPIHAVGRDALGRPFYSMKLVQGKTLQTILNQLRARDAATLREYTREKLLMVFRKVCDGVGFAHAKGVLHRDLKPENVMVGEFGEVLVMDWGLSKVIREADEDAEGGGGGGAGGDGAGDLGATMEGEVIGTPQYMPPEQAEGRVGALDERSDIYSLGAILYAILTLRPPVEGRTVEEVLEKVRKGQITPMDGVRPKSGREERPGRVRPEANLEIPEALQAVTRKAMSLGRLRRYRRVEELVRDIDAYQNGFATRAEEAGLLRQVALLVARHRAVASLVTLLLLASVGFTFKLVASERKALENWRRAESNARLAEENRRAAEANERSALMEKAAVRRSAANAQLALAESAAKALDGDLLQASLLEVPEDLRTTDWEYLENKLETAVFSKRAKDGSVFSAVAPVPQKPGIFVTLQEDGWVGILDADSGELEDLFQADLGKLPEKGLRLKLAVSPDGTKVAIVRQNYRGGGVDNLDHWDLQGVIGYRLPGGQKLFSVPCKSPCQKLDFSPDGKLLLASQSPRLGKRLQVWNGETGTPLWEGGPLAFRAHAEFSEDSNRIFATSDQGTVELESRTGVMQRTVLRAGFPEALCGAPGWNSALFVYSNGLMRRLDAGSGRVLYEERPAGSKVFGCFYVPRFKAFVTAVERLAKSSVVQVWDERSGALLQSVICLDEAPGEAQSSGEKQIAVHPNSGEFVMLSSGVLKVCRFQVSPPRFQIPIGKLGNWEGFQFLGNEDRGVRGNMPASGLALEILDIRDRSQSVLNSFRFWPEGMTFLSSSARGDVVVVNGGDGGRTVKVLRREGNGYVLASTWELAARVKTLHVSPNGDRFWTGDYMYRTDTGEVVVKFRRKGLGANDIDALWLGSGRLLEIALLSEEAALSESPERKTVLVLWDAESGRSLSTVVAPGATALAVSPDGTQIAEGGADRKIRIRNAETLEVIREFRAHDGAVQALAWHPKLPLLLSTSEDRTVKAWDTRDLGLVDQLHGLSSAPTQITFSPNGLRLAISLNKGTVVEFWEPELFKLGVK